ncbi:ATP-dependent nuclease [Neptuniibacter sp. QD72_48]|uniref:ATP-dependent nuclease n=1 Tax=Neptuniibacter sp. QD72_48 TaxID=3398214 RepID=UPI0039F449FA
MADPRKQLVQKYKIDNRHANFGETIRKITINGFRGIDGLDIEMNYPILAISGLNGAGKSTIGQICLSGYRKPVKAGNGYKRYYVRDFFPASAADPNPFTSDASVLFHYETNDRDSPQELTVRRTKKEWSGYKRQPHRKCFYIGFTVYIPKVERKDLSIYKGSSFALTKRRDIPDDIKIKVGRILGQQYDELHFQGIRHGKNEAELGIASRYGASYSENNMGFGEGRTFYMVDLLERSPDRSLFVIEEPETSLHEHAEYELAKYLLDVCNRKHHQIIFTTHSDRMLRAMPSESRLMLYRGFDGVSSFEGLSSTRARAMLSLGEQKELIVFVEDDFAALLLTEMIRRIDKQTLNAINIEPVGDTKAVRNAVKLMEQIGKKSLAVRDADTGPSVSEKLYSFPGTMPPEKEVYQNSTVKHRIHEEFGVEVDNTLALRDVNDHHRFTRCLAHEASANYDYFRAMAINFYLDDIGEAAFRDLVGVIKGEA